MSTECPSAFTDLAAEHAAQMRAINYPDRPDIHELEAGALRKILQEFVDGKELNRAFVKAALEITDTGRRTAELLEGYPSLVESYQDLADTLHKQLYGVLSCLEVCWDDSLVREIGEEFAAGRGGEALDRIVGAIRHAAQRKMRTV